MPDGHVWHSIDANRMCHTTEWCQNRGRCRNPELNLSCRGIVCNSLVMQTLTRICKVICSHFCNCLAISSYQALGLTSVRKKIEHGAYAGPKIGMWYVIERIYDIEKIYRDCMISTRRGFFEIRINHRFFLWWLLKNVTSSMILTIGYYRSSISSNDSMMNYLWM
jgi:hypothetical protein